MDHFINHKVQNEKMTSIDDFFQIQELKFDYWKQTNFPFDKIMDVSVAHELLGG